MKHVSILVPAGESILSSIVGAYKVFNSVNNYMRMQGKTPVFSIDIVGIQSETELYNGIFGIKPTKLIDEVDKTDLIIVTTINGNIPMEIQNNQRFIPWIQQMHAQHNAEVASLCMGAFLLAETGLLDGKSCATHWMGHDAFKATYPSIELLPDKIITDDNGIYTSGGAYSFLNLLLYIVEKHVDKAAAIWVSKLLEIEFDRDDQSQFIIFSGQKEHDDDAIQKAQQLIEAKVLEKISVEDLANEVAISKRNFIRRFKKATANTPLEYIQRVKIEYAKKQFESTPKNISEVMYSLSYSDDRAFRNLFKRITGISPKEYKLKYNRELVQV